MKVLKIPFSGGGLGHGNGANAAPDCIEACTNEVFSNTDGKTIVFEFIGLELDESHIVKSHKIIEEETKKYDFPLFALGGDHSITHPLIKAFASKITDFQLIVFDAHPDVVDDFRPPSQEDYLRVIIEEGLVKSEDILLIGIRNADPVELTYLKNKGIRYVGMNEFLELGLKGVATFLSDWIKGDIYVSIDIDVIDPVEAIGTGYIEHGGLSSRELIFLVHKIKHKIKMADIVEVNPCKDIKNMTSKLAAKLLFELHC